MILNVCVWVALEFVVRQDNVFGLAIGVRERDQSLACGEDVAHDELVVVPVEGLCRLFQKQRRIRLELERYHVRQRRPLGLEHLEHLWHLVQFELESSVGALDFVLGLDDFCENKKIKKLQP